MCTAPLSPHASSAPSPLDVERCEFVPPNYHLIRPLLRPSDVAYVQRSASVLSVPYSSLTSVLQLFRRSGVERSECYRQACGCLCIRVHLCYPTVHKFPSSHQYCTNTCISGTTLCKILHLCTMTVQMFSSVCEFCANVCISPRSFHTNHRGLHLAMSCA